MLGATVRRVTPVPTTVQRLCDPPPLPQLEERLLGKPLEEVECPKEGEPDRVPKLQLLARPL